MPNNGKLQMWTIFDRPADYPNSIVARLSEIDAGRVVITDQVMFASNLETIRARMLARGLACLKRFPEDHPSIVEVWL